MKTPHGTERCRKPTSDARVLRFRRALTVVHVESRQRRRDAAATAAVFRSASSSAVSFSRVRRPFTFLVFFLFFFFFVRFFSFYHRSLFSFSVMLWSFSLASRGTWRLIRKSARPSPAGRLCRVRLRQIPKVGMDENPPADGMDVAATHVSCILLILFFPFFVLSSFKVGLEPWKVEKPSQGHLGPVRATRLAPR